VDAVQAWKEPGVDMGTYGPGGQYVYRCPRSTCRHQVVSPEVLPAAAAIDWSLPPGERIGDRRRPLKPATLARIEAGLRRYAGRPMLAPAGGTWRDGAYPVTVPMPSRTTRESDGLLVPPLLVPVEKRAGASSVRPVDGAMRAQTARLETALVQAPFWVLLRGGGSAGDGGAYSMADPLTTFSACGTHHALIHPPGAVPAGALVMRNNPSRGDGGEMSTPVDEPLRTLTTTGHQPLITWGDAMLMPYYGTGVARPATEPVGTLTTRDRYALVQPDGVPVVEECTFRMLAPREIAAGMAFAEDYQVTGTKREQVAGYGNAVTPPAAEVIVSALVEAITGEDVAA
jgi:DNA (cytosine-5)-methyltransferase 1